MNRNEILRNIEPGDRAFIEVPSNANSSPTTLLASAARNAVPYADELSFRSFTAVGSQSGEIVTLVMVTRGQPKGEKPRRKSPNEERDHRIVAEFKAGDTLQAIGDRYGITRERVRQIVKRFGGDNVLGGVQRVSKDKKEKHEAAKAKRRDRKHIKRYGVSIAESAHIPINVKRAFWHKRRNAVNKFGPECWQLDLKSFYLLWAESGLSMEKTKGRGPALARIDATQPFTPLNCIITTFGNAISISRNAIEKAKRGEQ